jgi:hypothetical protein
MKNKKGFLLAEETLKIVIALICISFLIYFLSSLYFKNKDSKDLELAKASLERLVEEINAEATSVEIYNPKGWVLSSWPHDTTKRIWYTAWLKKEIKKGSPQYCENLGWKNCICICKKNDQNKCDDLGFCLESNGIEIEGKSIELENLPMTLNLERGEITKIKK